MRSAKLESMGNTAVERYVSGEREPAAGVDVVGRKANTGRVFGRRVNRR
jgi:hypothetical protein